MRRYPSLEEVILTHRQLIDRFGGIHGIRDLAALESALARPKSGYYEDAIEEAAALMESISQNHPFIDGNKRTAITVTAAFLRVNGLVLDFDDLEAYDFLMGLYASDTFKYKVLVEWLRRQTRPAR